MIATSDPLPPYKYSSLPLGIVHVIKLIIKSVLSIRFQHSSIKAHSIYIIIVVCIYKKYYVHCYMQILW